MPTLAFTIARPIACSALLFAGCGQPPASPVVAGQSQDTHAASSQPAGHTDLVDRGD
ncbi:MAG: hypothetical protein ACR2J7_07905 [Luteimonas sp.]